jgi:SAM-dependent methyltransferase
MAVNATAVLSDTVRAFDAVAAEYHHTNSANPILRHMRAIVIDVLRTHVPAGSKVIDLGCGPGTDLAALVSAGYAVTAIDASPEMARQARFRASVLDGVYRPTVECLPIERIPDLQQPPFDAAFSNFGPLNCVADLADAAWQIRQSLKPGGLLIASVIGRVCPWELALYAVRGDVARAMTRVRDGLIGVPLKEGTVWTRYWSPGAFERTCAGAGFEPIYRQGLAVVAPPPYLDHFAARRPQFVERLLVLDRLVGRLPVLRSMGDHFVTVMRRT